MPRIIFPLPDDESWARYYGKGGNMPGGYGDYPDEIKRIINPEFGGYGIENNIWWPRLQRIIEHGSLVGKTVIDLGCAFGHLTNLLIYHGADAYGLDFAWPISQARLLYPDIADRFIVADARVWLPAQKKNSWDIIFSRGFLDCLDDAVLAALIPIMNNVCKFTQIHSIDPDDDPEFYNQKTLEEWKNPNTWTPPVTKWEPGTIILDDAS